LFVARGEVDTSATFSELGVDSLGVVELVRDLNRAFELDLESVLVYQHPTIDLLVAEVSAAIAGSAGWLADAASSAVSQDVVSSMGKCCELDSDAPVMPVTPAPSSALVPLVVRTGAEPRVPASTETPQPPALRLRASPAPQEVAAASVQGRVPTSTPKRARRIEEDEEIAIVGLSARYPGAADVAELWDNLVRGRCTVTEVSSDRWDVNRYFDPDQHAPGKTTSKWAGLVADVDQFDASFFGISTREAELMDPQQRLFLEQAWRALEHAGYAVGPERQIDCGVFVGTATGDYLQLLQSAGVGNSGQVFVGNSGSILAARIAYFLNLSGPTVALDTACSSSLVALHLACQAIRAGDCSMALAGGVALMLTPQMHIWNGKSGMLSPRGRCASFDASGDGFVLGEGVGAVVLKRLSSALSDRDEIHAVIKASGINGDGKSNGITAPNATAQSRLLERVHARSGVPIDEIGYIETHGAGTQLGDPIEAKALAQLVKNRSPGAPPCGIGSVKSNLGHTTLAAGVAGLLKVVLSLKNREIPPSLHFERLNPNIDLGAGQLEVVTTRRAWPVGPSGRRYGAVNSFGVSGTNAHVVLAEAPAPATTRAQFLDAAYLLPLSAKTPTALRVMLEGLVADLERGLPIADVAFTLGIGRALFRHRAALIAPDAAAAIELARQALSLGELPAILAADAVLQGYLSDAPSLETPPDVSSSLSVAHLARLANAFVAGSPVDFHALYAERAGRRVGLTGYPFARRRYWVPEVDERTASATAQAPAASDPRALLARGEVAVDLQSTWVREHRVRGEALLPGAAVIHFGLYAAAGHPTTLSDIEWASLARAGKADAVKVRYADSAAGAFETTLSVGARKPCATALTVGRASDGPRFIDVAEIANGCRLALTHDELYRKFAEVGIAYGPSYRRVERIVHSEDSAVGWLRRAMPAAPIQTIDAVLQVTAALERDGLSVPRSIERLTLYQPWETAFAVVAVRTGEGRYDVTACDASGDVTAVIVGFRLAAMAGGATRAYLPRWRVQQPSSAAASVSGKRAVVEL
ncbi:MAG: sle, partial [Myxococcaceae bacterium]|nr:sle [Myxococcaceae bacterium]